VHIATGLGATVYLDKLWRDPRPFELDSPYGLGAASAPTDAWMAAPHGVWHAPLSGPPIDLTGDVVEAEMIEERRRGRLRVVLRNDDGRYAEGVAPAALAAGGELHPEAGYVTDAGPESLEGPAFWITALRRRHEQGVAVVEVEAVDGWGLLDGWVAPRQLVWTAGQTSAANVLVGVMLLAALPDEVIMRDFRPVLTEPAANDTTDAAFGTDHPILGLTIEAGRPAAGWARVFGSGVLAEAVDDVALVTGGGAVIVVDENLSAQPRADARAGAVLRRSQLAVARGELLVRPHAGLEVGDVVEVTSPAAGLTAAPFRVAGLRLRFARGGPDGRTVPSGGAAAALRARRTARRLRAARDAERGLGAAAMIERATLEAFNATIYTATVRFAGSLTSVVANVPVSRGIPSAELTAGRRVAVALFDPGHPVDAMVVGVH
jgi:hypothetical protein